MKTAKDMIKIPTFAIAYTLLKYCMHTKGVQIENIESSLFKIYFDPLGKFIEAGCTIKFVVDWAWTSVANIKQSVDKVGQRFEGILKGSW